MNVNTADDVSGSRKISVFLSYSRDDRARAEAVIRVLEAQGFDVWWDGLLEGGVAFARTTEAALESADAVLVLWSARAVQSHWVRDEATRGRDRGCMVPTSIDGTEPPLGFRQIQYVDLSKWHDKADAPEIEAVIRAIRATAAAPGAQLAPQPPLAGPNGVSRRKLMVAGGGAVAAVGGGVLAWQTGLIGRRRITGNSVAVIPFKNLSGDPAQSYFSEGLAEELRSTLSRNNALRVAAPTSAAKARDGATDAKAIAAKLGVAFVLMGSVRRSGDVVRIAAELIDGKTGFNSWAQSFDRKMDDIFAVQSEIAAIVMAALSAQVAKSDHGNGQKALAGGTANVPAYEAYLRGRAMYDASIDEASDRAALAQFDVAIGSDPKYAAAHAARSRTLAVIAGGTANTGELRRLFDDAIASARRATALAPDLPDAHSALGYAIFFGRQDAKLARAPYDRSRALGWGDADVLIRYGLFSALCGRVPTAMEALDRAAALDPLNPRVFRTIGMVHYHARRFEDSIAATRKALSLNPKMAGANAAIGAALFMLGRVDDAQAAYAAEANDLTRLVGVAIVAHKKGDAAAAEGAMKALVSDYGDNSLYQQAQILAQSGQRDAALSALERGHRIGDSGLLYMRGEPLLDPVRKDARFMQLTRAIGLTGT
jgi:TolB-like protein/tetratricopeptide (TPR) repeat protein